ncbi:MAG: hypothetical protein IKJ63_00505 [Clostridia bacterium]|nr:hypothetical protein [Clostridia bacterium]
MSKIFRNEQHYSRFGAGCQFNKLRFIYIAFCRQKKFSTFFEKGIDKRRKTSIITIVIIVSDSTKPKGE